jgi:hypothetical protein
MRDQRVTSRRARSSLGKRPLSGFFAARYWPIAFDSQRTKSPSFNVGERGIFGGLLVTFDQIYNAQSRIDAKMVRDRHHLEGAGARGEYVKFNGHDRLLLFQLFQIARRGFPPLKIAHAASALRLTISSVLSLPASALQTWREGDAAAWA